MFDADMTAKLWRLAVEQGLIHRGRSFINQSDWEEIKSKVKLNRYDGPQLDAVARLVGLSNGTPAEIVADRVEEELLHA